MDDCRVNAVLVKMNRISWGRTSDLLVENTSQTTERDNRRVLACCAIA